MLNSAEGGSRQAALPALRLSPAGIVRLDALVDELIAGLVGLWQLEPPLRDLYLLGFDDGRASLEPELRQAHADADRYYRAAFDPTAHKGLADALLEQARVKAYRARQDAA